MNLTPTLIRLRSLLLLGVVVLIGCSGDLSANRPYILTTATTGGTYYPVGVALATITKSQLADASGISLSAISSAGSLENVKLLRDNQAQFAMLQGIFAAWAWNGDGPFSSQEPYLRSIGALWPNTEHFVLTNSLTDSGTIHDLDRLDGERFVLGARNSGAEKSGEFILDQLAIDFRDKFTLAYMGYGATANAIQDGAIVGMNIPAGPPVSGITRAFAAVGDDIRLLNFSDADLAAVNRKYPLWRRRELPPGTYPNQTQTVRTIEHANVLVVREDIPDETVYQITRSIWENLAALHEIHKATRSMSLESALLGIGVPLHPGAARYYREKGLTIPAGLTPP
ncbi:MAG: TAXI family TRAP transporter solute-binding subunit [Pseudomonadota bacterium]